MHCGAELVALARIKLRAETLMCKRCLRGMKVSVFSVSHIRLHVLLEESANYGPDA
jgi:hypothetical protein